MRKQSLIVLVFAAAALAACSRRSSLPKGARGDGALEVTGAVEGGPYFLSSGDLAKLPQRTVRGVDPHTGRAATWQGTAMLELLERVKLRRGADTLVVTTRDGERIPLPVWKILEMRPVLADRADGNALPDRILAWPNVEQPGLDGDPRAREWWARGITKLEFVDWERSFGRALRPPPGASDAARLGAGQYGLRCVACHQLRGQGGTNGPELTRAGERLPFEKFSAAVEKHPDFAADAARRPETPAPMVLRQVWTFLREVAASGPAVAEEPPEEPKPKELEPEPLVPRARR